MFVDHIIITFLILFVSRDQNFNEWSIPHDTIRVPSRSKS